MHAGAKPSGAPASNESSLVPKRSAFRNPRVGLDVVDARTEPVAFVFEEATPDAGLGFRVDEAASTRDALNLIVGEKLANRRSNLAQLLFRLASLELVLQLRVQIIVSRTLSYLDSSCYITHVHIIAYITHILK